MKTSLIFLSIKSATDNFFSDILYKISWLFFKIIDVIEKVFLTFVGIDPNINSNTSGSNNFNPENNVLLGNLFDFKNFRLNNTYQTFFLSFLAISLVVWFFAIIIKVIKNTRTSQQHVKNKKLITNSIKSIVKMIAVPMLFILFFYLTTILIGVVYSTFKKNNSLAIETFISFFSSPDKLFQTKSLDDLRTATQVNEIFNVHKGYNYTSFSTGGFNFLLALLTGGIIGFVMFKTCVKTIYRLFNIIILYLTAPFVSSLTPLDDGKAFEEWKKKAVHKFFSVIGVLLSFFLFLILQQTCKGIVDKLPIAQNDKLINLIVSLLLFSANSLILLKGQDFIGDYIGLGSDSPAQEIASAPIPSMAPAGAGASMGANQSVNMMLAKQRQAELERKLYPNGMNPGKTSSIKTPGKNIFKQSSQLKDPNKTPGVKSALSPNKITNKINPQNKVQKQGKPKTEHQKLKSHVNRKEKFERNQLKLELDRQNKIIQEEQKKQKQQAMQSKLKNVGSKLGNKVKSLTQKTKESLEEEINE